MTAMFPDAFGVSVMRPDLIVPPNARRGPTMTLTPTNTALPLRRDAQTSRAHILARARRRRPHAVALGCAAALHPVKRLAAANGADRQRRFVAFNPRLDELVVSLADQFLAAGLADGDPRPTTWDRSDNTRERRGPCAAGSHTQVPPS